ncbi:GTP-binding protein GEM, partial [Biomphalaria glabrata]
VIDDSLQHLLDAYVVVFAINDHESFDQAQQLVRFLRVDHGTDRVILLVANKIDLVRKRKVTAD